MFDIGFWELLIIAVVALIVVGPEKLPRMVRVAGLWLGRANAQFQSVKNDIAKELRAEELRQALKKPDDLPDLNEKIDIDPSRQQPPAKDSANKPNTEKGKERGNP